MKLLVLLISTSNGDTTAFCLCFTSLFFRRLLHFWPLPKMNFWQLL